MADGAALQLLSGEKVLWEGHPYKGLIFRPADLFLVPFSLFWTGFSVFWNVSVWSTDAGLSFSLFGIPFLVMGLYVTIGRFLIDLIIRKNMAYFVTNKRILIKRRSNGGQIKSVDVARLPALELEERSDGSGTIRFGASGGWFNGNNFAIWQPTFDPTPQFIRIPNSRIVYELIQKQSAS